VRHHSSVPFRGDLRELGDVRTLILDVGGRLQEADQPTRVESIAPERFSCGNPRVLPSDGAATAAIGVLECTVYNLGAGDACFAGFQPARAMARSLLRRSQPHSERSVAMLWTIFVILLILWLLGMVSGATLGGFIHLLLILAIVVVLIRVIQGRSVI
jgi:uncharacterized protein DUF5670